VRFTVFTDGTQMFQSTIGFSNPRAIEIDVTDKSQLKLQVESLGTTGFREKHHCAHSTWADARLTND
jgi:hypothetical protein